MATRTATATRTAAGTRTVHLDTGLPVPQKQMAEIPDVNTIRKAIPAHCFAPSVLRSLSYVARDFVLCGALVYAAVTFIPQLPNVWYRTAAWITYGFVQGLVCTGIWILGHECGHGAFSTHRNLNDVVGWALHSFLMVPYFSWKYSHHRHHNFTGHMAKDMVFVPHTEEDYERRHKWLGKFIDPELVDDTPLFSLFRLVAHQLLAWPTYLFFNVSHGKSSLQRPKDKKWFRMSHFDPFSVVFRGNEALYVFLSDVGLGLMGYALYCAAQKLDATTVILLAGVPWAWVHHWLSKSL